MKCFFALTIPTVLYSSLLLAADVRTCSDLAGQWETIADSQNVTMRISPSSGICGKECVVLDVKYNVFNKIYSNKLYCHEGAEGMKGRGPMVMAFEGAEGGHVIGTYNRQLKLLWAGVIPKNNEGRWEMKMDDYWFKRVGN